jgi:hypothetical protein
MAGLKALSLRFSQVQTPTSANPLPDLTGERCTVGQHGRLSFLVGDSVRAGPITRNCRVPRDTALLIPIVNHGYFARGQTAVVRPQPTLSLKVDGKSVGNLRNHFVWSEFFTVQLPTDNLLGASVSVVPQLLLRPSCDAGYYVILYPLRPGNHVVKWTTTTTPASPAQNITYHLSIH